MVCSVSVFAQKRSLQLGLGSSFLGTGDIFAGVFEAEFGYKFNPYISTGFGINSALGYRNIELREYATYHQGNANIFVSPFRNDGQVDFKLGTGVSTNYIIEKHIDMLSSFFPTYINESRFAVGLNMIVESSFRLNENVFLGIKGFVQPYVNGDIHSGILLKIGTAL